MKFSNKVISLLLIFSSLIMGFVGAQELHKVEPNQTLYSIARLYQVTLADLMSWNKLKDTRIRPGQELVVKPAINLGSGVVGDSYVVKEGDTLESLGLRFSVNPDDLKAFNGLKNNLLRVGQRLAVRPPRAVEIYTVQSGDSLLGLSGRYGLSVDELKVVNQLKSDGLQIGQNLRVSRPSSTPLTHKVEEMDSLNGLATLYGLDKSTLMTMNNLTEDTLFTGQVLRLKDYSSADARVGLFPSQGNNSQSNQGTTPSTVGSNKVTQPSTNLESTNIQEAPQVHQVESGQTLYSIGRQYNIKVENLIKWNGLKSNVIKKGQEILLQPPTQDISVSNTSTTPKTFLAQVTPTTPPSLGVIAPPVQKDSNGQNLTWDAFVVLDKDIPLFEWNNDFYYWSHPGQTTQPNRGYYENQWNSPLASYNKAIKLWEGFENLLDKRALKSSALKGVTIVLDPGHGGLDPGAIVKSSDGLGDTLYITEDEYVYDIALRMVPLLREQGAQVKLTILSPNHLIRDTTPASRTLIHEKNEVYNSLAKNKTDALEDWPVGGARGLDRRVEVASELFNKYPGEEVFISIHADNAPGTPKAVSVLFSETSTAKDSVSEKFAQTIAKNMGAGAFTKGRDLGVLRSNPASRKVLVEVRNVAYQEHAWALRFANSRQMDAINMVNGILDFYKNR